MKINNMKVPIHLAIILDGNGRWALKNGFIRSIGHKYGANALKEIVSYSFELGVKYLSLYCFSTENWKRDKNEIDYLFSLISQYLNKYCNDFINKKIKVIFSGDLSILPNETKLACDMVSLKSKNCDKFILNICLNYGSKNEIIRATTNIAKDVKNGLLNEMDIDENTFEKYLYSNGLPSVDFLIRTSNEKRLSNFMLWQISYAEIYFCKTLWPEFTKKDLEKAFVEYGKRNRRYGGV